MTLRIYTAPLPEGQTTDPPQAGELGAGLLAIEGEGELEELTGIRSPDDVRTSAQASAMLDELRRLHDERRPPSAKQRRFIEDLIKQAGISDVEAARLVGAASLDELTGGAEGTASALIDRLQAMTADAG